MFYVAKTKALISLAVTAQLICTFVVAYMQKADFLDMDKPDKIFKVKQELCTLAGRQDSEIILAEVLDWHISRILVRYLTTIKYLRPKL